MRWVQKGQETTSIPKQDRLGKKVMLCVRWNFDRIVHFELVPNGRAISAEIYCQKLEQVYKKLKQKYPALINQKRFFFFFFFFFWKGSTFSDAGSDGIQPASCVDIQNRQSTHSCRCPMYGACQNDATLAIRCRSKAPLYMND